MNTLYVSQENLQLQMFTICICRSTKGDNSNDDGQKKQTHSHENNISINFFKIKQWGVWVIYRESG